MISNIFPALKKKEKKKRAEENDVLWLRVKKSKERLL
jgi:hypothetical protein